MLFDGAVTIENSEGEIQLADSLVIGATVEVDFADLGTKTAVVEDYEGSGTFNVTYPDVDGEGNNLNVSVAEFEGGYVEIGGPGSYEYENGEFALKIVQYT